MDDSFTFMLMVIGAGVIMIGGLIGGSKSADSQNWDNCIKYHDRKSVVEANKLCKEILGRTK